MTNPEPVPMTWFRCKRGTWVGQRHETSARGCCPFCGSPVELILIEQHWASAEAVERGEYEWPSYKKEPKPENWTPHPHPSFKAMWEWARDQKTCFANVNALRDAFQEESGTFIDIEP